MPLWTRMSRALRGDLHDVLDRVESPASALRQALRDMQDAHDTDAREAAALLAHAHTLTRRAQAADAALADLAGPLGTCLDADRDDLARPLLRRRLTLERTRTALRQRADHVASAAADAQQRLDAQRQDMEGLRERLALLDAAQVGPAPNVSDAADVAAEAGARPDPWPVSEAEVEAALLAEKQRRSGPGVPA